MSFKTDHEWFKRFRQYLRGDFVFCRLTVIELSGHLNEARTDTMQRQRAEDILGHPVDVAENFNRVTRMRRFVIKSFILTPAILGIGLSLIMLAPFQWWRLPFGNFSSLNIGDINWISGSLGGYLNGYSTEDNLLACTASKEADHGFLARFQIPNAWLERLGHCDDANLDRLPPAVRERYVRAVSDSAKYRGGKFIFLFSCPHEYECLESSILFNLFDESFEEMRKRDQGNFGLLEVEVGWGHTPKYYAKLTGEVLDNAGKSELRYKADGISDWDGFWAEIFFGVIGVGLTTIFSIAYYFTRILYLTVVNCRSRIRANIPRIVPLD